MTPRAFIIAAWLLCSVFAAVAAERKLVIAHYMTDMVPVTSKPLNRWIDPELADPKGSTAALGGLHQTVPLAPLHLKNADLETAVAFEIRAAKQLGVDGFQFYYPLVDNLRLLSSYNRIIREFLRQAESHGDGFKISICFAHPNSAKAQSEAARVQLWSQTVRDLLKEKADSVAWLRTDSGKLLFYLWVGDALADGVGNLAQNPEQIRSVAKAYRRFSDAVDVPIEFIYQVRRPENDRRYIDAILESFHGVWGWTASEENPEFWDSLAKRCKESNTIYTQSVYPDYYTSKVYRKGGGHAILTTEEALKGGKNSFERHYRVTNLAQTPIDLLERAIHRDAAIINYVTWNDYPEGHHLAPEKSHNFGPSRLLRHFKRQWQTGAAKIERDQAIVFFKKYPTDAKPKHATAIRIKSANKDLAGENRIALVTLLTEPAEVFLNDHALGRVNGGLTLRSIPTETGSVRVRIVRDGDSVIEFATPVGITSEPLRTDRLTYSFSNSYRTEFEKLFSRSPR